MTTASDNFNRANEAPIASPWVSAIGGGANLTTNALVSTASIDRMSYYGGTWANDQECTGIVGNLLANTRYSGLGLRFNGDDGFEVITDGTTGAAHTEFGLWTNGSYASLAGIATTFADGDAMRFTVSGVSPNIVLTLYKNAAQVGQATGVSGPNAGNPGAGCFDVATIDDWSATDGGGGASALFESEWPPMEPQTNPLTVSVW
jgi:hypothetical protein